MVVHVVQYYSDVEANFASQHGGKGCMYSGALCSSTVVLRRGELRCLLFMRVWLMAEGRRLFQQQGGCSLSS